MTLCRRGRSVLVLTLVFGLTTVSIIPAESPATRKRYDGARRNQRAALRQPRRHALVAAADGCLDQFTGSGPVLKPGVLRQFQADQRRYRAGLVQFRGL